MKPNKTKQSPLELLDANVVSWILEKKRPAGRYWTLKRLTDGSASEVAASRQAIVAAPSHFQIK